MLRGRHRGLPVAIDRAIMLPMEFDSNNGGSTPESDDNSPPNMDASSTAYSSGLRHKLGRASSRASRRSRMSRQSGEFNTSGHEHRLSRQPQHATEDVNNTEVTFDVRPTKR
jgi:hypothetical protein